MERQNGPFCAILIAEIRRLYKAAPGKSIKKRGYFYAISYNK